jgi:hypothetical protein
MKGWALLRGNIGELKGHVKSETFAQVRELECGIIEKIRMDFLKETRYTVGSIIPEPHGARGAYVVSQFQKVMKLRVWDDCGESPETRGKWRNPK